MSEGEGVHQGGMHERACMARAREGMFLEGGTKQKWKRVRLN